MSTHRAYLSRGAALAAAAAILAACGADPAPPATSTTQAPATSSTTPRPESSQSSSSGTSAGRPTAPTGRKGTPRGGLVDPKTVDETSASDVAQAYARTAWTIDTRIDKSHADAQRRAQPWLDAQLAKELTQPLPIGTGWADLVKTKAWTTAKTEDVSPDGSAPTGLTATRVIQTTVTTKTASGKTIGKPEAITVLLDLTRTSDDKPWRVTKISTY